MHGGLIARPRKYIQVDGKTIDGVSLHKATNRYYILHRHGKQVYFRSWREASEAHRRQEGDPVAIAKANAVYSLRHAAMYRPEVIAKFAEYSRTDEDRVCKALEIAHPDRRVRRPDGSLDDDGPDIEIFADGIGAPRFVVLEEDELARISGATPTPVTLSNNPRLQALGEHWLRHKMNGRGQDYVPPHQRAALRSARKSNPLSAHMRNTLSCWQSFVACVGNIRIAELGPAPIRKYHEWAERESAKKGSTRWHGQQMAAVKSVFNQALRDCPEWKWPDGLAERLRTFSAKPYEARESNAEPMPPEIFRTLVAQCDAWAATDLESLDRSSQSGRAKRLQAQRRQPEGRQMRVILELALNCGLNAVDCERLRWSNLKLDAAIPHMDLPRHKSEHATGQATTRRTPLLPQVIESLRAWKNDKRAKDDLVFRTAQGTPISLRS